MCELAMLMLIAVIATGYLVEQLRSRGGGRRGRHRAARDVYESSLGLADDPELRGNILKCSPAIAL